jgi:hypothetical protein
MTSPSKAFPPLTYDMLDALERKVEAMKTTVDDCYLIDHYLTSIGKPGLLLEAFKKEGIDSLDDIDEALDEDPDDLDDLTADAITGCLLGAIHGLQYRILAGEKIF